MLLRIGELVLGTSENTNFTVGGVVVPLGNGSGSLNLVGPRNLGCVAVASYRWLSVLCRARCVVAVMPYPCLLECDCCIGQCGW